MSKIDLLKELPKKDKEIFENYVCKFSHVPKEDFVGVEDYLRYWSKSKVGLYKLLGNQFKVTIPFAHKKSEKELKESVKGVVRNTDFCELLREAVEFFKWRSYDSFDIEAWNRNYKDMYNYILTITEPNNICNDVLCSGFKWKAPGQKSTFQFQKGGKVIKALGRFIKYLKPCLEENKCEPSMIKRLFDHYEEFRIKHSMALNDKILKGNLVLSILPMDFVTMSDNNSNWTSCMSWTDDGCYHLGTVEMMNSNNVICCYLEGSDSWTFDKNANNDELNTWNNKKWRTLLYLTKDIIMSGKNYPYYSEVLSKECISVARNLAKENFNRTYTHGIERYMDMIHINSLNKINRNRNWASRYSEDGFKHNIIFDTNAMYNDMLNDNNYKYWCVRNKVERTKLISVSGKAPCMCCNDNEVLIEAENNYDDYNERFYNTGKVICDACYEKGECAWCRTYVGPHRLKNINEQPVCQTCAEKYFRVCPCCNKTYEIRTSFSNRVFAGQREPKDWAEVHSMQTVMYDYPEPDLPYWLSNEEVKKRISESYYALKEKNPFIELYICKDCLYEMKKSGEIKKMRFSIDDKEVSNLRHLDQTMYFLTEPLDENLELPEKYQKLASPIMVNIEDYPAYSSYF